MTDYAEETSMGESPSVTKLRRLLKEAAEEITVARERIAQLEAKVANCPSCERLIRAIARAAAGYKMDFRTCPPPWRKEEVCPRTAGDQVLDDGTPAALEVCVQCWRDYKDKKRKRKYRE